MRQNLGQHFLKDADAIRAIIDALDIQSGDTVIEIGPGTGALTKEILRRAPDDVRYVGIEKDPKLAGMLTDVFTKHITLGDVRDVLQNVVSETLIGDDHQSYKVVGNIPYYLTGYLFRLLSELTPRPSRIVLTVQKEVAERVTAAPPKMNLLAASVQAWADVELVAAVPRGSFSPPPDVDSAVLLLVPHTGLDSRLRGNDRESGNDREKYYEVARVLFAHPRKTIRNNLEDRLPDEELRKIGIDPGDRPQNLSVEDIARIANYMV